MFIKEKELLEKRILFLENLIREEQLEEEDK